MTRTGLRSLGTVLTAFVVGFAATLVGCASVGPVTPVAVSDIKAVPARGKASCTRSPSSSRTISR